jgi:hypothetical protein
VEAVEAITLECQGSQRMEAPQLSPCRRADGRRRGGDAGALKPPGHGNRGSTRRPDLGSWISPGRPMPALTLSSSPRRSPRRRPIRSSPRPARSSLVPERPGDGLGEGRTTGTTESGWFGRGCSARPTHPCPTWLKGRAHPCPRSGGSMTPPARWTGGIFRVQADGAGYFNHAGPDQRRGSACRSRALHGPARDLPQGPERPRPAPSG